MPDKEPVREQYGVGIPKSDRAPIRFFEGVRFLLRDKGAGAGDNTVLQRLQELHEDVASQHGGFFDAHAQEFLGCFQPVKGIHPVDTNEVPTLFDQLAPALTEFKTEERREVLQYLVHDLSLSLVKNKQPRPEKTGRNDINERTRGTAKAVYKKLEEKILEHMDPTPIPGQTQFDRMIRVPVRAGETFATILLALQVGGCTSIRPTVTPEITPPAITQPAQTTEAHTPTIIVLSEPTFESTSVATEALIPATETPIPTFTSTSTPEPTKTATATPEQLGGDKVAVIIPDFDSRLSKEAIVALIEPYINTPTSPEAWPTILGDFMFDNANPVGWGDHFIIEGASDSLWANFPALLRDVIEINDPVANGTLMISIYEIPAYGGSNFLISIDQYNANSRRAGYSLYDLDGTLPAQWFNQGTVIDIKSLRDISSQRVVNSKTFVEAIRNRINEILIIQVPIGAENDETAAFKKILSGELLSSEEIVEGGVGVRFVLLP